MSATIGLLVAVLLPLAVAAAMLLPSSRRGRFDAIAAWAALPALLLSLLPLEYTPLELPWVLLGTRLELDLTGRFFLIVAAGLWTAAGVFARTYLASGERRRFFVFFLLTMSGNLALPIAADAATFYCAFALMTFAGYGLVVHTGSGEAARAGRIYIVLGVLGEGFLLAGLLIATQEAGTLESADIRSALAVSPAVGVVTGCLLVGFGIKAGAVPLHMWLPLAHPVAPTPASAVLSGSMIKAGLLGWLRFLPLGEVALPGWGLLVIAMGIGAAFFGVVIGLLQTDTKTVLAYSSVSQMGVINIGVGIALAAPDAAVAAVGAVLMYAVHHGLAKGALFLGVGVADVAGSRPARLLVGAGMFLAALAVAGAPLTSGSVAKGELKTLLPFSPGPWPGWLEWLLPLSAFATTLLMARFLYLLAAADRRAAPDRPPLGLAAPWGATVIGVAVALRLLPRWYPIGQPADAGAYAAGGGLDILPLVAGGLVVWLVILLRGRGAGSAIPRIAAGDIVNPLERLLSSLPRPAILEQGRDPVMAIALRWYQVYAHSDRQDVVLRLELLLTRWAPAILLLLVITAAFLLLLVRGS